jgi:hypothetical protein
MRTDLSKEAEIAIGGSVSIGAAVALCVIDRHARRD